MFNWLFNSKKKEKNKNESEKEEDDAMTTILLTTDELMDRKELGIEPESDSLFGPFGSDDSYDSSDAYDSNDANSKSDDYDSSGLDDED